MKKFFDPIASVLLSLIFFISVLFILSNIVSHECFICVKVFMFCHTYATQTCGKVRFTRATGESEYPRQYSTFNIFDVFTVVKSGQL